MSAIPRSGLFASPSFRRYFTGQALSYVGDGLRTLAVPLLVYHLTGSALSTGAAFLCEWGPFAVFGLLGGSLADRVDRRRLMIACDLVRFIVMAAFAALFATRALTVAMLYAGLVVISICAALFQGGQSSSIPYLLGKSQTTQAAAALLTAESTSNTVVPMIGGALFGIFGPLPALVINAFTYLCSQASLALVPTLGPERPQGLPGLRAIGHDAAAGFRFLLNDDALRAVSLTSFMLNTFGIGGYSILIPFLKRDFGAADATVGVFLGISAIGAVLGSLLAGKYAGRWPFGRALTIAYLVDACFFVPVVLTHNVWIAGIFWAIGNGGAQFEVAQIVGWRMRVTPGEMVGRVFGAVRLFVLCGMAPGVLAFGYVADRYGPHPAMTLAALGYLAIALGAVLTPAIRNEDR